METFSFGTDPEFMLYRNNRLHSAIGVVQGTKSKRIAIEGHEFYYDNVMAECAVKPAWSKEEVLYNIRSCLKQYVRLVRPFVLTPQGSAHYPTDEIKHPDAREAGCKVEYCAYLMDEIKDKRAESIIKNTTFRTAGGHVHLGGSARCLQDGFNQIFTIRMLDLFLGIPITILDSLEATACERRAFYGQAGRHRRPPYGLEYRTPGNYWFSSPKLVSLVYDLCKFTLQFVEEERYKEFWTIGEDWHEQKCHGYNVQDLKRAINKTKYHDPEANWCRNKFLPLIQSRLPAELSRQIDTLSDTAPNMYREWGLC